MSEELRDEVTSINAIYEPTTLVPLDPASTSSSSSPALPPLLCYALTLPSHPAISLRLEFPPTYPAVPPAVLGPQTVGDAAAKGDGAALAALVRDVLADVYVPGAPCVFDVVEEVCARAGGGVGDDLGGQWSGGGGGGLEIDSGDSGAASQIVGQDPRDGAAAKTGSDDVWAQQQQTQAQIGGDEGAGGDDEEQAPPTWTLSDVVTEKKSVFVARAARVADAAQARRFRAHLLTTDKKAARATHNVSAWRIRGEAAGGGGEVRIQDCDDDGESAAGARLLHLLEVMGVWDALVVVSRWYGGVHLGPDRFRIINQTAREALVRGGFVVEASREAGAKKKSKKS